MPTAIETATQLYQSGKLGEADSVCESILKNENNNTTALHLRGVIAYQSGKYHDAIALLAKVNEIQPNNPAISFALAASYGNTRQYSKAIKFYRKTLTTTPDNFIARQQLANCLKKNDQIEDAISEYQILEKLDKDNTATLLALAKIYNDQKDWNKAKYYAEKIDICELSDASQLNTLGVIFNSVKEIDQAEACFNMAIDINADDVNAVLNLASLYQESTRHQEAESLYLKAIQHLPANSENAKRAFYNIALIELGNGNFKEAWGYLENRPKYFHDKPDISQLKNKKILIIGEEGLGDELTFLRFFPLIHQAGATIDYVCNKKLLPIVNQLDVIDNCYSNIPVSTTHYDHLVSAMDLPSILKIDNISNIHPIKLVAKKNSNHPILNKIDNSINKPFLGITWRAGVNANNQSKEKYLHKSIPVEEICLILEGFTGTIVILQRNPIPSEIDYIKNKLPNHIIDASQLNDNLELMLSLLSKLDHYLGVSNTNMHLFGSLGKSCDVIVPFPGEWRWMSEGEISPWYPTFNIVRQKSPNTWRNLSNLSNLPKYITSGKI